MTVDHDSRARTHLANERTFLAWFRTGITLVALGLAAAQFLGSDTRTGRPLVHVLATVVIVTGAFVVVVGMTATGRVAAGSTPRSSGPPGARSR